MRLIAYVFCFVVGGVDLTPAQRDGEADVDGHSPVAVEDRDSPSEESLEWMVGAWRWTEKSRRGELPAALESLAWVHVFAFTDYSKPAATNGTHIAAEFRTRSPDGQYETLPRYPWVTVYPDGTIIHGLGFTAFKFKYRHGSSNQKPWWELELVSSEDSSFTIRFEKADEDPGAPLRPEILKDFVIPP
jgi:hypothetical protein